VQPQALSLRKLTSTQSHEFRSTCQCNSIAQLQRLLLQLQYSIKRGQQTWIDAMLYVELRDALIEQGSDVPA
jgi:hypothetical protein